MRRRTLSMTAFATLTAWASSGIAPVSSNPIWLLDDGIMELTPEYNVQYMQGEADSQAIAAFHHFPSKRLVRLRPGDAISVNGKVLEEVLGKHGGYFYRAQLPTTGGGFTFTLLRAPGHVMTHRFELPLLGLSELPKVYRRYEQLLVPVTYTEPPEYVVDDSYNMDIYGPLLRFDLTSAVRKKDNRLEFERLPHIRDGAIVFRHTLDSAPQPGTYAAAIYRQHHVVLNKLSDASATGWAKLTSTQAFKIEVK